MTNIRVSSRKNLKGGGGAKVEFIIFRGGIIRLIKITLILQWMPHLMYMYICVTTDDSNAVVLLFLGNTVVCLSCTYVHVHVYSILLHTCPEITKQVVTCATYM